MTIELLNKALRFAVPRNLSIVLKASYAPYLLFATETLECSEDTDEKDITRVVSSALLCSEPVHLKNLELLGPSALIRVSKYIESRTVSFIGTYTMNFDTCFWFKQSFLSKFTFVL